MNSLQTSWPDRFHYLDTALQQHRWLWSAQPFKQSRPSWCEHLPELTSLLLNLPDEQVERYTADSTLGLQLLAEYLPELFELNEQLVLPWYRQTTTADAGPHIAWEIPGRKWQQITAFQRAVTPSAAAVVEWCGGKGHLGRLLANQWRVPVATLEWNETLCREGERLAARVGTQQRFHCCDIHATQATDHLKKHHVVALHACGSLHRKLLRDAVEMSVPALDLVPCCYAHGLNSDYIPFSASATLNLSRDEVRLAVTDSATATPAQIRLRDREMAWKLGFDILRRELLQVDEYRPIPSINKAWLNLPYRDFCRQLAQREGLTLPSGLNWQHYENIGWYRQREVMRLSLVRIAFRRALEMWLVLDMGSYLTQHGYRLNLGTFCERDVSPRNILLSARKTDYPSEKCGSKG